MSSIYPSGDQAKQPGSKIGDPFAPIEEQLQDLDALLGMFNGDFKQLVENLYSRVADLPPEERFTDSVRVAETAVSESFGSSEVLESMLPFGPDRLGNFMDRFLDKLIEDTIERVWFGRDNETSVILAAGYTTLRYGFKQIDIESETQRDRYFSAFLAYFSRLYDLAQEDELSKSDSDRLIRDVARTIYYVEILTDGKSSTINDPESDNIDRLRQRVAEFGAVVVYSRLNISVGRGAELAGISRPEFEDLLQAYDFSPRYGPDSVDELYENE